MFKEGDSTNREKIDGSFSFFFQEILRQNVTWFFVLTEENTSS